jgi:A/G-specific adenine glycosylase
VTDKRAPTPVRLVAAVVRAPDGKRVLLAKRPTGGLFGGLWEPPMVEADALADAGPALEALGVPTASLEPRGRVKHVLSHRVFDVAVARAEAPRATRRRAPRERYDALGWLDPSDATVGISTLARKILAAAR